MNMFYKKGSIKTPYDFDKTENPTSEMSTDNSSPDAWVRPEMLKRISEADESQKQLFINALRIGLKSFEGQVNYGED
jgi:hypothetical protein